MSSSISDTKLKEYDVDENAVFKILTKVNMMKREVEMVHYYILLSEK